MNTGKNHLHASLLLLSGVCALSISPAQCAAPAEMIVIGTLHGAHGQNVRYSLDVLRDLIVELKPAAILIELPPAIGGQPTVERQRVAGRFATDENWSANAAADVLQVAVIPYDRDGRNEFYSESKYFDRQSQLNRRLNDWLKSAENRKLAPAEAAILGPLLGNAARSQDYFSRSSGPDIINSEGFDRVIRIKHFMIQELMPQLSAKLPSLSDLAAELAFFRDEWQDRNSIMADNIAAQAGKRPGQRIVVLCGCEHRYILRDLLASRKDMVVKEFYEAAVKTVTR